MALLASILALASQPTGTIVLPNTNGATDVFVLEGLAGSTWSDIASDQYRVLPSGFVMQRSRDASGADVDWSPYDSIYATGNFARPDCIVAFVREPLTFIQSALDPVIDEDGAPDLAAAYNALVRELINADGGMRIDENGLQSGRVLISDTIALGGGNQLKRPHVFAEDDSIQTAGASTWSDLPHLKRSDNVRASAIIAYISGTEKTGYILATDFRFKVPFNAIILGVKFEVEGYHVAASLPGFKVQLLYNGSLIGTESGSTFDTFEQDSYIEVGGATDVWGTSDLTPAIINDASFGVAFYGYASIANAEFYVDSFRVTVYYRTATGQTLLDLYNNNIANVNTLAASAVTATTVTAAVTGTASGNAPVGSPFVTVGNDATLTGERALTGTGNQVTVTDNGAGSTVVLSLPQNIHSGATPTFAGLNVGAIAGSSSLRLGGSSSGKVSMNAITNLANNGVAQIGSTGAADIGLLFLLQSDGTGAIFSTKGGAHAVTLLSSSGTYSVTAGTAGTNVYWSAGNSRYEIENKSGATRSYQVLEFVVG